MFARLAASGVLLVFVFFQLGPQNERPLLVPQVGHRGDVTTLAFSADSAYLLSATRANSPEARIWELAAGREVLTLVGHTSLATARFHPSEPRVVTAGDSIQVWSIEHGKWEREIGPADGHVRDVTFSGDGTLLVTGSRAAYSDEASDNVVRVWEWRSGRLIHAWRGHAQAVTAVAIAPRGDLVASGDEGGAIIIWDPVSGRHVRQLKPAGPLVHALEFSTGSHLRALLADHTVEQWDVRVGRLLEAARPSANIVSQDAEGTPYVGALSPAGDFAATVHKGWYHPFKGLVLRDLVRQSERVIPLDDRYVTGAAFSADERYLASGDFNGQIRIWDRLHNKETHRFSGLVTLNEDAVLVSHERRLVTGGDDGLLRFWDLNTGAMDRVVRAHEQGFQTLAISQSGRLLATGATTSEIRLWNGDTVEALHVLDRRGLSPSDLAFSPDERSVAAAYQDGAIVRWSTTNGKSEWTRQHSGESIAASAIAFSPDGSLVLSGGGGVPSYFVYERPAERLSPVFAALQRIRAVFSLLDSFKANRRGREQSMFVHSAVQSSKAPQSRPPVTNRNDPIHSRVNVWDAATGALRGFLASPGAPVSALAFSPDGRSLVAGSLDGSIVQWDWPPIIRTMAREVPPTRRLVPATTPYGGGVSSLALSPDGTRLAYSINSTISLVDLSSGKTLVSLTGHTSWVPALLFSPEGKLLISVGRDGTIRVWRPEDTTQLATLVGFSRSPDWLAFTPEGFFDGTERAWQLTPFQYPSRPLKLFEPEQFFSQFFQPRLVADIFLSNLRIPGVLEARGDPRASMDVSKYRESRMPTVTIARTTADGRSASIELEVQDNGSGARDLRVFRNGSLVHHTAGDLRLKAGVRIYQTQVQIALATGTNLIEAYAFSRDDVRSKTVSALMSAAGPGRRSRVALIAVGVNRYGGPSVDLQFAVPDAQIFAERLSMSLTGLRAYEPFTPNVLTDETATKARVLETLRQFARGRLAQLGPDDDLVVFFAGHGFALGDRYFLIPYGVNLENAHTDTTAGRLELGAISISDRDLEGAFRDIDARRILLIVDACESGQLLESGQSRPGPMNSRGMAQLAYEKGIYLLGAAQSRQTALELQRFGHGILTHVLVREGLDDLAADRNPRDRQVTVDEWLDYTAQRVPRVVQDELRRGAPGQARPLVSRAVTRASGQTPRAYYRRLAERERWVLRQEK
jgi:WD40 repeat protein/uncharacterized caspase-like protein